MTVTLTPEQLDLVLSDEFLAAIDPDYRTTFGGRGLTQEQLAGRLGVDPTYVSRVECGRQGVCWYTVIRFLAALEATQHQLADALDTND